MSEITGSELGTPLEPADDGRAVAAFVLGVLSALTLYVFPPFPLLAIALGSGRHGGLGRAGLVLGWIGVALYAALALIGTAFWLVGGGVVLAG